MKDLSFGKWEGGFIILLVNALAALETGISFEYIKEFINEVLSYCGLYSSALLCTNLL